MTATTPSPAPPPTSGGYAGTLILVACVLSRRIRHGVARLGLGLAVVGGLWPLAASVLRPDLAGVGAALVGGGVLAVGLWLVSSGLAWLLRIFIEDVRADFLTTETDD
jgi:hypothetical protein